MPIDYDRALALDLTAFDVLVERGRLRAFAAAIGESDPVYVDLEAARSAGHRDLPVPPTFLFSLELEGEDPFGYLDLIGADLRGVLHGEQSFDYRGPVHAGDTITVRPRIVEAYAKNDRMDFVVKRTDYLLEDEVVAESQSLIVIRSVAA